MINMKEVNGYKYSKKYFEDYKMRYKIEFDVIGQDYKSNLDIYSTNEDEETVFEVIGTMINKVVVSDYRIVHKSSKQSDDNSSKLIEETIKTL